MAKKRIYYNEFRRLLNAEPVRPVYLFTGAEPFLKEQAVRAIIDKVLDPSERQMNLEILYAGTDISGQTIVERAQTLPFLGQQRVLIIRQAEKLRTSDLDKILSYAAMPVDSSVLVLVNQEERVKLASWKKIAGLAFHVECYPLFDNQLPSWVEQRFADHGKRIAREGIPLLIEKVGGQLDDLENEIVKLSNYVGSETTVTAEHIRSVAGDLRHETTYDLNAACGKKNRMQALVLSQKVLEEGVAPLQVLGSLTWHFRHLFGMKKKLASGETEEKVLIGYRHPQAKREWQQQLNSCRLEEFEPLFEKLLDLDIKAKSGYQHWPMALQLVINDWCQPG